LQEISIESLFNFIHESALPGVWSKGVALSRSANIVIDHCAPAEVKLRVVSREKSVHPQVTLWPEDEDAYCDCEDRNDPCIHIVASVVGIKNNTIEIKKPHTKQIVYKLSSQDQRLYVDRYLRTADDKEELLVESLVAYVGGVQSGRIVSVPVAASQDDYKIDRILSSFQSNRGPINSLAKAHLLAALENADVILDQLPVKTSGKTFPIVFRLVDCDQGFLLKPDPSLKNAKFFEGGLIFHANCLSPLSRDVPPDFQETYIPFCDRDRLVKEIIPELQERFTVILESTKLPEIILEKPRAVIHLEKLEGSTLIVHPKIVYGNPVFAEVINDTLLSNSTSKTVQRDHFTEIELLRNLRETYNLIPGHISKVTGSEAVTFIDSIKDIEISGSDPSHLFSRTELSPDIDISPDGLFSAQFCCSSATDGQVPFENVFKAFQNGDKYLQMSPGLWGQIPESWLQKYADQVVHLLNSKNTKGELPKYHLLQLVSMYEEQNQKLPDYLEKFKKLLDDFEGIPLASLPVDLTLSLRSYQKTGINWLQFMRQLDCGAMLADDMGLGKTVQTLCAISGRTLVIAPTSVLDSWNQQIKDYRPSLHVCLYHGADRRLCKDADVTLTSYGILKLDTEKLGSENWKTIVLDEAQVIRNPDSQVAQAVHSLKAPFRLALSGTPIENRIEDLWSQFHFLNPGLLGDKNAFIANFSNHTQTVQLRNLVRPFILRRLKKDVAKELPAKTEVILHNDLDEEELELYNSLLTATKAQVLTLLNKTGNIFGVLELLLRLRQTCCHPALVPGGTDIFQKTSSSKIDLLLATLETSLALGHRALVFSQWTSLLDLIEPLLAEKSITYSRLDGSTRNRDQVISEFQKPDGPNLMLISLKAGGLGITLTAADHVFIMDPWWNPAVEEQASDRAHRLGQTNPVLVHKLVAKNTIEEKVIQLQRAKQELAKSVLSEEALAAVITREDILNLLNT